MEKILQLEPKPVFYWFHQISQIPRGSKNTKKISDFLVHFAKKRSLEVIQDEIGNVIIIKEATRGYEAEEPVILQGHMDMVAVKTKDTSKDLKKEGLDLEIRDGYLFAKGTSLGGDDGIAIAYMLALLDSKEIQHPRLEMVMTVDEEIGMDGAREIDLSMLKGKRLLNIDSEEEGIFLAGCAGGARVRCILKRCFEKQKGVAYKISIHGLKGGHSGVEIQKKRANANVMIGKILLQLAANCSLYLKKIEGGFADNAISVWAESEIIVPKSDEQAFEKMFDVEEQKQKEIWKNIEKDFEIDLIKMGDDESSCLKKEDTFTITNWICTIPNGVCKMSEEIKGLVETSLNLGMITWDETSVSLEYSVRSSIDLEKDNLIEKIEKIVKQSGGTCEVTGKYPGWAYSKDSMLRKKMMERYELMFGEKPKVEAIHAGLECGLFMEKIKGLDCVSFGPDILDIHTVDERLDLESTKRMWEFIVDLLEKKDS